MRAEQLVAELNRNDDWPWGEWRNGQAISARGVAQMLKRFSIRSFRTPAANIYREADFSDVWQRYLPPLSAETPGASSTSSIGSGNAMSFNSLSDGGCALTSSTPVLSMEDAKLDQTIEILDGMELVELGGMESQQFNGKARMTHQGSDEQ
jgi:hypothetical protein